MKQSAGSVRRLIRQNRDIANRLYPNLSKQQLSILLELTKTLKLSVLMGELLCFDGKWYVTHSGLLQTARRRQCSGIKTKVEQYVSEPSVSRWVFRATVYKSPRCKGFVGFGDADPSNVSPLVRGAEMRVAETRAVNRALRKAYGIGICSVEELGSAAKSRISPAESKKPPQPVNGNRGGPKVRDRLCQLIRQYQLDPNLVKAYAIDFCGTKTLRDASRAQVENFVKHLNDWAEKDRNALICQLNSYLPAKEGAA